MCRTNVGCVLLQRFVRMMTPSFIEWQASCFRRALKISRLVPMPLATMAGDYACAAAAPVVLACAAAPWTSAGRYRWQPSHTRNARTPHRGLTVGQRPPRCDRPARGCDLRASRWQTSCADSHQLLLRVVAQQSEVASSHNHSRHIFAAIARIGAAMAQVTIRQRGVQPTICQ